MATPTIASFPFARFRRLRFGGQRPSCVHCGAHRVHRWGHFSGRRRYRCTACGRTFSDFTGTALASLKLLDRWPTFCHCMLHTLTVRQAAAVLGVDKDTAFRWRHRLLAALYRDDATLLTGAVALWETWFPESQKGSRKLDRPPRTRRALHRADIKAVWVIIARDPSARLASGTVGFRRPEPDDLETILGPHLDPAAELVSTIGHYGAPARMADRTGHTHRRAPPGAPEIAAAHQYVRELHRWIRRFRGVATRYLDHYLAWHRLHSGDPRAFGRKRQIAPSPASCWLLAGRFP